MNPLTVSWVLFFNTDSPTPKKCYTIPTTMTVDKTTSNDDAQDSANSSLNTNERDYIDDLILQNKTLDALIKGLSEDIETFKTAKKGGQVRLILFASRCNLIS